MNGRRLLFEGHAASDVVEARFSPGTEVPEFPFALMVAPEISERVQKRAVAALVHAARFAPRPIVYARIAIRMEHEHTARRPVTASASLDVSGRIVTARATADAPLDALDLLERRLRRNLDQLDARRRARRRRLWPSRVTT